MSRVDLVAGLCFSLLGIVLAIHSLLACSVSVEKSAASLIIAPLYVTSCFYLVSFKILSLSLNFDILIMMCLGVDLFGFMLIWTLCASWTCEAFLLSRVGKFSIIIFETGFLSLVPFLLFLILLWFECCCVSCCPAVPLSYLHIFLVFFSCCSSTWVFLSTLCSSLMIQSSISPNLLLIPSTVFFISDIVCFISSCLLLIASISFHAGVVLSKFLEAFLEFFEILTELLEHPYNHYFELDVW